MATISAFMPALATLNYGLFIKPMGDELGIGRSIFGWAMTARQLAASATGPLLGRLLDRFGSRVILAIAAIVTGSAIFSLGFIREPWQLILLFGIMGLIGAGPGGSMVTSVPLFKWFVENRGKAIAFSSLGIPVGAIIFIPLTQVLIASRGWREAWIILAVISVAIIVPVSLVLVRRQPEDMGLLPDGVQPSVLTSRDTASVPVTDTREVSWTVKEAMRSRVFWRLVAVFSLMFLAMGSISVHRIPAFMDRGLDASLIAYATAFDAILAGLSTFISGLLVRRLRTKFLGAASIFLLAVASVLTINAYTLPVMFLAMAFFGLGIGGTMFCASFLWAEYFGREHLGSIIGIVTPLNMLVGGIGPPLAGYVRDATGRYDPIWWASVSLLTLCAVALATTASPGKTGTLVSPVPDR